MTKALDITGLRKGRLIALERIFPNRTKGRVEWLCKCDCGETRLVIPSHYVRGAYSSCGCFGIEIFPSVGDKYTSWTVLEEKRICGARKYLCRCDCGNESIVSLTDLRLARSQRCVDCGHKLRANYSQSARNYIIGYYKNNASKLGREFSLPKDLMIKMFKRPCYYCGVYNFSNHSGKFDYNGIDRVDNSKGYIEGNVVTCCSICNKAKSSMPQKDFIEWLERIAKFRNKI